MTNEQINITIAEHCGFTDIMWPTGFHQQMSDEKSKQAGGRWRFQIPDYCNDLNAMHEVELKCILIDSILTDRYSHNLYDASDLPSFSSTARQRAEAFLKTIGKWEA